MEELEVGAWDVLPLPTHVHRVPPAPPGHVCSSSSASLRGRHQQRADGRPASRQGLLASWGCVLWVAPLQTLLLPVVFAP